jgi:hypothetical protein
MFHPQAFDGRTDWGLWRTKLAALFSNALINFQERNLVVSTPLKNIHDIHTIVSMYCIYANIWGILMLKYCKCYHIYHTWILWVYKKKKRIWMSHLSEDPLILCSYLVAARQIPSNVGRTQVIKVFASLFDDYCLISTAMLRHNVSSWPVDIFSELPCAC